ncbi:hypothetical protein B5E58_03930 [Tyzzerella sp. An114]|uniref:hypothetical protein n=1 Tax=Tyzzerella sp. An114 TaxID=1965545 RepID=UPI000B438D16|nr:hypothetical protein [Tyzzerella sp. An114]OUQ59593.1 hypothetical protein B5E58_03930 [Tyzzerella sp. An114]HIT72784.1 hypothetical protein [Candidatus Fimicola cottocaccae]
MSTFELKANCIDSKCSKEECIIAQKIFDQCRIQKCLTPGILGVARTYSCGCDDCCKDSEPVTPPSNASSVSVRDLVLSKISIVSKKKNPFKNCYWDVEVRFTFVYTLMFKSSEGCEICSVRATSSYNTKVTLYGSDAGDVVVASDLYCSNDLLSSGPFVSVEGKAIGLLAELKYTNRSSCCDCNCGCGCDCNCDCGCDCGCNNCNGCNNNCNITLSGSYPVAVCVTIGLFAVIKLFRPVNIVVKTEGFCIPDECKGPSTTEDPCDFFNNLEFPMSLFEPGFTGKVSNNSSDNGNCNCGCGCK